MTGETFDGIAYGTEPVFGLPVKGHLVNVHPSDQCAGQACVIHNPSDHHMRDWPLVWRGDKGCMERECEHGCGHPDPDDMTYQESIGRDHLGIHGCDGCCSTKEIS